MESFCLRDDQELVKAIRQQNVKRSMELLVDGANPNFRVASSDGDYPIHIAVRVHNVTLVKLLIIFYADLNVTNNAGETPYQLAVRLGAKAQDCATAIKTVVDLEVAKASTPPRQQGARIKSPPGANDDDIYLLTLDGGGIRGLVFLQVMLGIERRKTQLYPHSQPFISYFNWIGGTSAGGLAALGMAGLKASPEHGRKLFLTLKDRVFTGPFPYTPDGVFQEAFGTVRNMASIVEPNVSIMTTLATTAPPKLHIMSNYGNARDGQVGPDRRLIWEAARATSAAVPYFNSFDKQFIDGGFIANNPTSDTIVDILHFKPEAKIKVVLSMGCGYVLPEAITEPDFHPINSILDKILKLTKETEIEDILFLLKNIPGTKSLIEVMTSQITQPCAEVQARGEALAKCLGAKYYRLDPRTSNVSFIESESAPIIDMMYEAMVGTLEDPNVDSIIDAIVG